MGQAADRFAELPEDDDLKAERFLRAVEVFREFDTAFPASYMAAFMCVARDPGKGASDYARQLGVAQPVASRLLLELGKKSRYGGEGLGLVDSEVDGNDLRVKRNYITPKGKQVLRKVLMAMGRIPRA